MTRLIATIAIATALLAAAAASVYKGHTYSERCGSVAAMTEAGLVCGEERQYQRYEPSTDSWGPVSYTSFRGIPYATPPLGELRFQELLPVEPWEGYLNASVEGPNCYQYDYFFNAITDPRGMDEDCITVNIHVPTDSQNKAQDIDRQYHKGMPILVFIHGGGFQFGSGDADVYGPEYMISKGLMVVTFNYRLGPFGFLSLNTSAVPGNAGLRDMVTLLKWVQRNCGHFGGDIHNVTIAGQSAGASAVHLLTLSPSTTGLFHRAVMMSGTAVRSFFSVSPSYNTMIVKAFLALLNITSTDSEEIHRQLVTISPEYILAAHKILLDQTGLMVFLPIVESAFAGVNRIIDDDTEVLLAKGRGKHIPLVIGYTAEECETFRPRFQEVDIADKISRNPKMLVPPVVLFTKKQTLWPDIIQKIQNRYFANGNNTIENFVHFCSEACFIYPALYTAQRRTEIGGASVHLYQFRYQGVHRALQRSGYEYTRAAHAEDLTYLMKINSDKVAFDQKMIDTSRDGTMQRFMQSWFSSFIRTGSPVSPGNSRYWPAVKPDKIVYQDIKQPGFKIKELNHLQEEMMLFFRDIYR